MGSSSRKRAQKKADFVKPKLKVGKARPKPDNATSTSFASKKIVLPTQQTLNHTASTRSSQIQNHLSYLKSASSSTRSEHLSALSSLLPSQSQVSSTDPESPQILSISSTTLLNSLNPLILDPSASIRRKLPELYALIPPAQLDSTLPYIRAGLSHLHTEIRGSSADIFAHIIRYAGADLLSSPGSWVKCLKAFCTVLGWEVVRPITNRKSAQDTLNGRKGGWTTNVPKSMDSALETKFLASLTVYLSVGLTPATESKADDEWPFPLCNTKAHLLPTRPNAFAHLNLFGEPRDEEGEMYTDARERGRVFRSLGFEAAVGRGVDRLKGEGGEVGRAAGALGKVIKAFELRNG